MVLAALLAVVSVPGAPARAQAPDPATLALFTADDVKVDVTADSAVAARDQALMEGQAKGLRQVMRDLAPAGYQDRLPEIGGEEAQNYVLSLQVEDEKRSNVRYIATLDITYNPDAVRQLLRMNDIPFSEQPRTPVLVVPLWQAPGAAGPILWEDPNPWRAAWNRRAGDGLVPTRVPLGDLGDLRALSADEAAGGDAAAVRNLLQRYDMTESVVARAALAGEDQLAVDMTRYRLAGQPSRQSLTLTRDPAEDRSAFLSRAADEVAARLRDDQWQGGGAAAGLSPDAAPQRMTAIVPTSGGLETWLTVRERLGQVPLVRGVEVQALSRERAQILLGYMGDVERLTLTLAQYGLDMSDLGGGVWRIELRRAPAPAEPARQPMITPEAAGAQGAAQGAQPATQAGPAAQGAPQQQPGEASAPTPGQGRVMAPR
ncbi:DUF2066 domain-containing protein [Caenispirillum salinarum]|uniref:DUF2066 domain-containing protein n=1 Tax=Caenispirillum salinarum TaxID=859058 RepID=UPI00384FDF5C